MSVAGVMLLLLVAIALVIIFVSTIVALRTAVRDTRSGARLGPHFQEAT